MFCMKLAEELGVEYDSGAPRRVLYYGGNLVEGAKKDYKKDLLGGQNIFNTRDLSGGLHEVVNQTDDGMRAVFGQMGL